MKQKGWVVRSWWSYNRGKYMKWDKVRHCFNFGTFSQARVLPNLACALIHCGWEEKPIPVKRNAFGRWVIDKERMKIHNIKKWW